MPMSALDSVVEADHTAHLWSGDHLMVLQDHEAWAGIQAAVRNYPDGHRAANGIFVNRVEEHNHGRIPELDKDVRRS